MWWPWPLPVCFALLAAEFAFRFDRLIHGELAAASKRPRSGERHELGRSQHHHVGGLVALMSLGLSVVGFAVNIVAALLFLGASRLSVDAERRAVGDELTPIPFFVLMGEVLFHSGVALKRSTPSLLICRVGRLGHRYRRRHGVARQFLPTIATTAARQPDAADHAGARLRQAPRHGSDQSVASTC
jgi:hypothetical protein